MIFIIALLFVIWSLGIYHIWRRQTASVGYVSVTLFDRLIAMFWPLIYLMLLFTMALQWLHHRNRRSQQPRG